MIKQRTLMMEASKQRTKYVLECSRLKFIMPKIKLIIPKNLELEDSLSLKLSTDMSFEKESKEQHCVEYVVKKEDDGTEVETEITNVLLDAKSDMKVSLSDFKMYISQKRKPEEPKKRKSKEDYIISPVNFTYKNGSESYGNHQENLPDRHLVTLNQNQLEKKKLVKAERVKR